MTMAITLQHYLDNQHIHYDVIPHRYSRYSMQSAETSHIKGHQIAKCVVLEDSLGCIAAVLPATHIVDFTLLHNLTGRSFRLANEQALADTFGDCVLGAVPALGEVYDLNVICDDDILNIADAYFEAGDHTELVHLRGDDFRLLMRHAKHGRFSYHI